MTLKQNKQQIHKKQVIHNDYTNKNFSNSNTPEKNNNINTTNNIKPTTIITIPPKITKFKMNTSTTVTKATTTNTLQEKQLQ